MYPIETTFVEEIPIPQSLDMILVGDVLYLEADNCTDDTVSVHELPAVFGKKAYSIRGYSEELGPYTSIRDTLFFLYGDNMVGSITGKTIRTTSLEDILATSPKQLKIRNIDELGIFNIANDGLYVYIELDNGRFLKINQDLGFQEYTHQPRLNQSYSVVGNSQLFCSAGETSWDIYSLGQHKGKVTLQNANVVDGVSNLEYMMQLRETKQSGGEAWKLEQPNFAIMPFTDGTELYCVTSLGHCWHVTTSNAEYVTKLEGLEQVIGFFREVLFETAHNGNLAAVVLEPHVYLFSKGKLMGKDNLNVPINTVKGIAMDNQFLYVLTNNSIRKYVLLGAK